MIPVIDCENDVPAHGSEIIRAISDVGFVYLLNYGFPYGMVCEVESMYKKFWLLPQSLKEQYSRAADYETGGNSGYVAPNVELLDPKNVNELRESYNITPRENTVSRYSS
jgi:isopenicillin N synthase-like dioxygenase